MKKHGENGSDSEGSDSCSDNERKNTSNNNAGAASDNSSDGDASGSESRNSNDGSNNSDNESQNSENESRNSGNESPNTSRTTKSSDNNESRNTVHSDDEEEDDDDNEKQSDNNSGSGSGSGSDNGSGSGSDSDGGDSNQGSGSGSAESDNSGSEDNKSDDDDDSSPASADDDNNNSDDDSAESDSDSDYKKSKRKREPAWERNPDMYGVRRSSRDRKQTEHINLETSAEKRKPSTRARGSGGWHSSASSGSDSDSESPSSRRRRPPPKQKQRKLSREQQASKRSGRSGGQVSYKEQESESESSYESDAEDDDNATHDAGLNKDGEECQVIEKILEHRTGKKGAVGMGTYLCEVEKHGDPNTDFDPENPDEVERQFKVKWKGWAHIHNTWESEESLRTQKVKGIKKLENYLRKDEEILLWKNSATPEEIEYMEIQSELEKDLLSSHLHADRVFAEAAENSNNFFYVKWLGLPYSESTWELEGLVRERFPEKIVTFSQREKSSCTPRQCPALKHRPKFASIKEQPSYLCGTNSELVLRDYQMQGLNWLVHAWCKHNSVILADEMGLGKTIQAIAFVSYMFHTHSMYGPYLFVVPLSTLNAWEREFTLWAPDINVIVYIGDRDSRKIIRDHEWSFTSKRLKFNVVITTYEIMLRDKDELKECLWSVLAIDEAHRLKNEESQLYQALMELKSNHRLLITGTPLQNSMKELWALLHFIMPNKFDDWSAFESQHDVHKMSKGYHKLHKQLEPFLFRRVKKDVEKSLPAKVEQILRVDMTKEQKQYYKWILTKNYDMLRKGKRGSTSSFINIVMELKKCCNHSFLTRQPEEYATGTVEMLQQLLRGSGKLVLLDKLLMRLHETGHRVLIFSQMVRQLDILSQYLQLRRLTFQRLDGSIRGELRKQALDHFNADGSSDFCFLLSTRAGGLGINLATADTVIIFDSDWNPQNDLQAQARAHRIGQKNQVNIYRLVTKNSIEENIIERAKQKMVLDHLVIQSMDTSGRTVFNKKLNSNSNPFNKDELNAILKFGADELFKDDDEENDEPVCDIDEILRRAETREDGPASGCDDLLSAFKVASINLDEDEEVSRLDSNADENAKDWDEIIPENLLKELQEEAKAKEMADLYLPPRSRKTVQRSQEDGKDAKNETGSSSSDSEKDEEGSSKKRGRPKAGGQTKEKECVKGFTEAEVRRFFRSMKRFSNPLRRLDTIGRDADLRDKPAPDLKKLAETIINHCVEFMDELKKANNPEKDGLPRRGKHSGNSFKLSGVSVNAKTTLSTLEELAPLDTVVPHAPVQRASWVLPLKKVKDTHWDTTWTIQDDSRLLCGIYEYGMGSWEQIKSDPALSLGDKILVDNDAKPQAKHLEARAQYLLKLIKKHNGMTPVKARVPKTPKVRNKGNQKVKEPVPISREIIDDDSSDDDATTTTTTTAAKTGTVSPSSDRIPTPAGKQSAQPQDIKVSHHKEIKEAKEKDKTKAKVKEDKHSKENKIKAEVKEESSHHHHHHHKKKKDKKDKKTEKHQGPVHITANGEPVPILDETDMGPSHPMWSRCKGKMKSIKKNLMELSSGCSDKVTEEQQVAHTKSCLVSIGDHITAVINQVDPEHAESWKILLWRFVSTFTEYDAKKLHKLYVKTKKHGINNAVTKDKPVADVKKEKSEGTKDKSDGKKDKPDKRDAINDKSSKSEKQDIKEEGKNENKYLKRKFEHPENTADYPHKKSYNGNDDMSRDMKGGPDREQKRDRDERRDRDNRKDGNRERGEYNKDNNRGVDGRSDYRSRSRDRDGRDRCNDRMSGGYQRHGGGGGGDQRHGGGGGGRHRDNWHHKRGDRGYPPQGGYHRDNYNEGGGGGGGGYGGYQRGMGGSDWRPGGRPPPKHHNYGPPHPVGGEFPPPHYPPPGALMGSGPPQYGGPPPPTGGPGLYPPFRGDWGGPRPPLKDRDVDGSGNNGGGWQQKDRGESVMGNSGGGNNRGDPRTNRADVRPSSSGSSTGSSTSITASTAHTAPPYQNDFKTPPPTSSGM
uniref:Chromodomain-helicase-DNA-binding protein 1-like n=2 Tax=Hirondellea gigas TaxID=1518452 RepID=A0A6A7FVM9_9CRUS